MEARYAGLQIRTVWSTEAVTSFAIKKVDGLGTPLAAYPRGGWPKALIVPNAAAFVAAGMKKSLTLKGSPERRNHL